MAQNTCLCQDANAFGSALVTGIYPQCGCADLEETVQLAEAYCTQIGIDIGPAFSVFIQDNTKCGGSTGSGASTGTGSGTSTGTGGSTSTGTGGGTSTVLAVLKTPAQIIDLLLSKLSKLSLGSLQGFWLYSGDFSGFAAEIRGFARVWTNLEWTERLGNAI